MGEKRPCGCLHGANCFFHTIQEIGLRRVNQISNYFLEVTTRLIKTGGAEGGLRFCDLFPGVGSFSAPSLTFGK